MNGGLPGSKEKDMSELLTGYNKEKEPEPVDKLRATLTLLAEAKADLGRARRRYREADEQLARAGRALDKLQTDARRLFTEITGVPVP